MSPLSEQILKLAQLIKTHQRILVFTGAGISTESGISDYRSKGGLWDRFQPITIQEFLVSEEKQKQYWQRKLELFESMKDAKPNDGHKAIVDMAALGKVRGIVTQNIDGLHQLAGSPAETVLELHGTNREVICLSCQDLLAWQDVYQRLQDGEDVPICQKCQGLLKPNTISFGQSLKPDVLEKAIEWGNDCDLFLVVGSTLVVEPAASMPRVAQKSGAALVIITLSETPLDTAADLKIAAPAGKVLGEALDKLKK